MEPRITTLLDQSPYKRVTLDPSVLTTTSSSVATRYTEPGTSVNDARLNRDSQSHKDHVESRIKTSLQAHSSAPLARVLNDSTCPSRVLQPTGGHQTPQHAAFRIGNDDPRLGPTSISPDARRRDRTHNPIGISGSDASLIQLPKPPQALRKTVKRPRIPPLLQGLHQPPPLPPKSRLFPPITSDRSGLVSDVGERFGLGNAFSTSSTEELAKARVSPHKTNDAESDDTRQARHADSPQKESHRSGPGIGPANHPPVTQTSSQARSQVKAPRKRTRWTQKETEDLLTGVSRFGIGRWKQILDCTDFQFQGRTAVDLKDRFRVCRPGEGLKVKVPAPEKAETKRPGELSGPSSEPRTVFSNDSIVDHTVPLVPWTTSEETEVQDSVSQAATSKTDVHGPFLKSKRRARREFSDTDDKNLLKGFKRYGPVWHLMRNDCELGFDMRHPTDLRDRFRIRYPELFSQAGYKLKPKEERVLKDRASEPKAQRLQASSRSTETADNTSDISSQVVAQRRSDKSTAHAAIPTMPNAPSVTTGAPVGTTSQTDPMRPTFDLMTDLTFDDDDGERSPIILNRNILQWADENSSSAIPATTVPAATLASSHTSSDMLYNPFTASDGLHINPLATLKLPSTAHWSYMNPPSAAPPSLPPPGALKHGLASHAEHAGASRAPNSIAGTAMMTTPMASAPPPSSSSTVASRTQADMRAPNLPNIVFPYVPNASARNAVHNLPPPADILSSGQAGADGYIWIG
ncbi:chromatin binding [Ascochyta rabiei]|uniref:Chromatin binding n=1 Tax=Didymella rabiei TaxID=5454 RepID=A0A163DMZ5_DIDRA|nr:chromatin binding [Ascochyta rabiei]